MKAMTLVLSKNTWKVVSFLSGPRAAPPFWGHRAPHRSVAPVNRALMHLVCTQARRCCEVVISRRRGSSCPQVAYTLFWSQNKHEKTRWTFSEWKQESSEPIRLRLTWAHWPWLETVFQKRKPVFTEHLLLPAPRRPPFLLPFSEARFTSQVL